MFWVNLTLMIIFCIALCLVPFGEPFVLIFCSICLIGAGLAFGSPIVTLLTGRKERHALKAQAVLSDAPDFATRLAALRDTFQEIYDLLYPDPTTRPIAGIGWCPPKVAPVVTVPPEPIYFLAGIPPLPSIPLDDYRGAVSRKQYE